MTFSSRLFDFKITSFYTTIKKRKEKSSFFLIAQLSRCFKEKHWVPVSVNYTTKALNYQIPRTVTFGRIKYRLGLNASALSVTDHRFRRNVCGVWRRQTRPWKPPLNMQEPGKLSVVCLALPEWRVVQPSSQGSVSAAVAVWHRLSDHLCRI